MYTWYAEGINYPVFNIIITDLTISSTFLNTPRNIKDTTAAEHGPSPATGITSGYVAENLINLYPNPAKDQITVSWTSDNASMVNFSINDLIGKEIKSLGSKRVLMGEEKHSLNLSGLEPGVYLLVLESEGRRTMKKVVVR